ncbi:MAG: ImmA/IrrE family metallo-endopeptidase [Bacteroidota bacterium]|nr:ImmA/IrrE family metallo-endopeptidase [Bacteroidota bacterium]
MVKRHQYQRPGRQFIEQSPPLDRIADFSEYLDRYAHFLREESGVGHCPPIDLDKICKHFGITFAECPLDPDTEGASSEAIGWIGVNSQVRARTRKRFTVAHELVELLVAVLRDSPIADSIRFQLEGSEKEALCNSGAASLLIPPSSLQVNGQNPACSATSIRSLARRYQTSFLATTISVVRHSPDRAALVAWKRMRKPTEERKLNGGAQLSLGQGFEIEFEPKLRIRWTIRSHAAGVPFLPVYKSAAENSVIHQCLREQRDFLGSSVVDPDLKLGPDCTIDAIHQHPESEFEVLTLLRWPKVPSS